MAVSNAHGDPENGDCLCLQAQFLVILPISLCIIRHHSSTLESEISNHYYIKKITHLMVITSTETGKPHLLCCGIIRYTQVIGAVLYTTIFFTNSD